MLSGGGENRDRKKFYVYLFAVAFGVNLIWEISQVSAFADMPGKTMSEKLFFCSLASVIDALTTVGIFWLLARFLQKIDWKFYLAAAFAGAICAVFFEWTARVFGLWSYGAEMIVVPFVKTGLLPFAQLTLLVPLAIFVSRQVYFKNSKIKNEEKL